MVKNYKYRNTSAAGEKSIGTKERAETHIVKEVSRMRTFTKEQSQALLNQAEEMMKHMEEGQSVRDVMARIYVENLDEKTMSQGQMMADAIIQGIKDFDSDYQEAQGDLDRFIRKFQDKADDGKSREERCNYWLKTAAAVSAAALAMKEGGIDEEEIMREIEALAVTKEEATPEREKELRDQAREAIKQSGIMLGALAAQAEELEGVSPDEAAEMLLVFGNQEMEYRAVAAMIAYTKIKKGEFENVPVEMTAAQVACIVCAEVEQTRIAEAVGKGSLAVDVAAALLNALGAVVIAAFAISLAAAGLEFVLNLFPLILAVPGCMVVGALVTHGVCRAWKLWKKDSRRIAEGTAAAVRFVLDGIKAILSFAAGTLIPGIVKKAEEIYARVRSRGQKAEQVQVLEEAGAQL